jgi:type II secretory ATPase GspE/PulE/Tfp pilus assembly ATPase PilB-like protein
MAGPDLGPDRNAAASGDGPAAPGGSAPARPQNSNPRTPEYGIASPEDLKRAVHAQRHHSPMKLGQLLLEAGLITAHQLAEAMTVQAASHKRLGDILIDMGLVTTQLLQLALSNKLGIPLVNVSEFRIEPMVLELISRAVASRCQTLPLLRMDDALVVAVENPLAVDFIQELRFLTGCQIIPVLANPEDLRRRIAREYASNDPMGESEGRRGADLAQIRVEDLAGQLAREVPQPLDARAAETDVRITDNTLVRLVNKIVVEAHAQGASDIHIESNAGRATTRIRFRRDGDLEDYLELPPAYRNALISRIKVMADLDISEHRHAQDGKIDFARFGPLPIEMRVAVVPTSNGLEDVVLRILGGVEPLPLEKLGLGKQDFAEIKRMVSRSYGLILVCGPTGSGKTTTLHSILHHINRPDIKIWTAEDPVEITQAGLRQVQINSRIDWTFAAAMRAFLRADPDVIMVGEMRDAETTKIGIEASLTGHLVFSTLHTNSAAESIVRLLDLGMDPFNFADALIGILSQRLARRLCSKCRRSHVASEAELADLAAEFCIDTELAPTAVLEQWQRDHARDGQILLYEAAGCKACRDGYKGRVGVYELLSGTPQVKQLVRSRGTVPELVEAARGGGMRLLRQDAIDKVLGGLLDLKSARAASC